MRDDPPGASLPTSRILVRGVNWLGDAVMTTPSLERLREAFPQAHIALLCPEKLRDIWLHFHAIDEALTFARGQGPWSVGRRLSAARFDTALVYPHSPRAAFEAWLASIPRRIGYAQPCRSWFLTQAVAPRSSREVMSMRTRTDIYELNQSHTAL